MKNAITKNQYNLMRQIEKKGKLDKVDNRTLNSLLHSGLVDKVYRKKDTYKVTRLGEQYMLNFKRSNKESTSTKVTRKISVNRSRGESKPTKEANLITIKGYDKKVKDATKLSSQALERSDKAIKSLSILFKKEVLNKENMIPSNVVEEILSNKGRYKTVYQANIAIDRSANALQKVKETTILKGSKDIKSPYMEIRALRDSLKASFMVNPEVAEKIKTIKHQELMFDVIFSEFIADYTRLKINIDKLQALEEYLTSGFLALNGVSKTLNNKSFQEGVELAIGGSIDDDERVVYEKEKVKSKKRRVRKKDLG